MIQLRKSRYFSDEEITQLIQFHQQGLNDADIAHLLNRSKYGVRTNRLYLSLSKNPTNTEYTVRRKSETLIRIREENGEEHVNYLQQVNQYRAALIGWPEYHLNEALILYSLVNHQFLSTQELQEKIKQKKEYEKWKPYMISYKRFSIYISHLKHLEMIQPLSPRRNCIQTYSLTEKAMEEFRTRKTRRLEEAM